MKLHKHEIFGDYFCGNQNFIEAQRKNFEKLSHYFLIPSRYSNFSKFQFCSLVERAYIIHGNRYFTRAR
jgi:hypothetical protein